jgi:general stress protein CsbA
LEVNLTHYQINYAILFLLQMVVAIITNPHCLVVICVLVLVWMVFLKKNDDPNWEVNVGGVSLGKTQRWMVLSAITSIVLLCVVGQILFSAAFFCAVLVVIHGILHPAPEVGTEEVFQML